MTKATHRTVEEWAAHLAAWKKSGTTQRAYCAEHGLREFAFSYWKRKLERVPPGPARNRMVEVSPVAPMAAAPLLELRIGEHLDVSVQLRIPGRLLRALLP